MVRVEIDGIGGGGGKWEYVAPTKRVKDCRTLLKIGRLPVLQIISYSQLQVRQGDWGSHPGHQLKGGGAEKNGQLQPHDHTSGVPASGNHC